MLKLALLCSTLLRKTNFATADELPNMFDFCGTAPILQRSMECLNEPLQRCDKGALVGIVKSLCVQCEEILEHCVDEPQEGNGELDKKDVKTIVQKALLKCKSPNNASRTKAASLSRCVVVVGAGVVAGNPDFQIAEIGGRERASTGLLKVGGGVLSFMSTFLSWEKVKL